MKPCPFCGGEAEEDSADGYDWTWIKCSRCGARNAGSFHCSRDESLAQWNQRLDVPEWTGPGTRGLRITAEQQLRDAFTAMGYPEAQSWSSGDCMVVYSNALPWKPTHRHSDGGEYRLEFPVKIKLTSGHWHSGVCYSSKDHEYYATLDERWKDRFTVLPILRLEAPRRSD